MGPFSSIRTPFGGSFLRYRNQKANAGFALHCTGGVQARVLRALGSSAAGGSVGGPAQKDPAAVEW